MTINLEDNPELRSSCMEVARKFSDADLRAHPSADDVMAYFSENAVFTGKAFHGTIPFNVSKRVATIGFKYLIENSVLSLRFTSPVKFEIKSDHIVWSFETVQLRQGLLPSWVTSPTWYKIKGLSNLYFEHTGDGIKISKSENLVNEWTPCERPV